MATNHMIRSVLALALCVAVSGVAAAQSGNPRVTARDQLNITVWGVASKDFTNKYPVALDGSLEFPQLGRLAVAGLTAREVGDLIAKRLKDADILLNPQVTVELEQTPNKKVFVNGAVRTQGAVQYAGELTLLEALVKAGGRLPDAADEVLIYRQPALQDPRAGTDTPPGPTTLEVNAREIESGMVAKNIVLQDGDAIFVRKAQAVTITGFVRNVGAYNIESGTTVLQALALAGGVNDRGSEGRIEITRKVDGKTITLKNVKKTDIVMPGDIIKVGPRRM